MTEEQGQSPLARMNCKVEEGVLHCRFTGRWTIDTAKRETSRGSWRRALTDKKDIRKVSFEIGKGVGWDSVLVVFIRSCLSDCKESKLSVDMSRLPSGLCKLFLMTEEKLMDKVELDGGEPGFLTAVGELIFAAAEAILSSVHFLGE